MSKRRARLGTLLLLATSVACAFPVGGEPRKAPTMKTACEQLRTAISKRLGASHGADEYRCEDGQNRADGYSVFALRSNYPAPNGARPDWVGSGLVGWYAIRVSDGQVREWDVANLRLGAALR